MPCIIINCWRSVPLPCGQYMAIFRTASFPWFLTSAELLWLLWLDWLVTLSLPYFIILPSRVITIVPKNIVFFGLPFCTFYNRGGWKGLKVTNCCKLLCFVIWCWTEALPSLSKGIIFLFTSITIINKQISLRCLFWRLSGTQQQSID